MTCWRRSRLNPRKWKVQAQNTKAAQVAAALGSSAAKPQSLHELLVPLGSRGAEAIEELAALVHHAAQPAPPATLTPASSTITVPSACRRRIGTCFQGLGNADSDIGPVRRGDEHSPFKSMTYECGASRRPVTCVEDCARLRP